MNKKVYICGLHQESNSFNPCLFGYESFRVHKGEEITAENATIDVTVKGMLTALKEENITAVGGVVMRAFSGGPLTEDAVNTFIDEILRDLQTIGKVDGVLMSMHGATLSSVSADVCGDIFEKVRSAIGQETPISASFDLHANITEKIMRTIDFISGYQTYPHLDMYETGYRAARRMIERLQGKRTKTARVAIPQIAPAHAYTTGEGALGALMKKAQNLKDSGKIIDYNIFQVQPWLDIKDIASTVVICAETEERAKDIATELAKDELALREELQGEALPSVAEIVQKALSNDTGKPIVLGDSADSPNAGACGDCAEILECVLPYQETLSVAVGLMDPVAVEKAFEVGEGNTATFSLGATIAPKLSKPVTLTATVQGLYDGDFYRVGPQEKGVKVSLGKTAVLQAGKVRIHLVCKGLIGDLGFYRAFGTEPSDCQLVCVKACTSFRAGYAPISHAIYNANTRGAAGCSLKELPYKNLPKPFYPFEEIGEEDISHAKIYR